jgi:hypothetical protein
VAQVGDTNRIELAPDGHHDRGRPPAHLQ